MARTLSQDLRDRVVAAIRWRRLALKHGQAVARPRGGGRHSGKIEAHSDFIKGLITEQGDLTLVEIQARLIGRGDVVPFIPPAGIRVGQPCCA